MILIFQNRLISQNQLFTEIEVEPHGELLEYNISRVDFQSADSLSLERNLSQFSAFWLRNFGNQS